MIDNPSDRGASILLGVVVFMCCLLSAVAPAHGQFHVGPVYTSSDPASDAPFPRIKVVVATSMPQQTTLQPGDITLVEDGVESGHATAVRSFESTGYPLAAAVAIDVSGSMAGTPINIVRDSLSKFVSDARTKDKVGVLTIADDAIWDVPFDADRQTLKTRLQSVHNRGTLTRLYDGVLTALSGFDVNLPARRELTVISDGHDEGSRSRIEDDIEMAHRLGIAIDTIGLTRSSPAYLRSLMKLASETGGSFRQVHSDKELQALVENGLASLKASPVATFEAHHIRPDGKSHRIGIRLKNCPDHIGETTFQAPDRAANPFRYFVDHVPKWTYALLAVACAGFIVLVLLIFRGRGKRAQAVAAPAYITPTQSTPAYVGMPRASETISEATSPRQAASPSPVYVANRGAEYTSRPVPEAVSSQRNEPMKTRQAGVFKRSGETIARLEAVSGGLAGRSFDVSRGNFWIGAAGNNELVIPEDTTVSSRHAYLIFEDPILILVDNQSTNGTRINGEMLRAARRPLRPGDQIQIGRTLFRVVSMA